LTENLKKAKETPFRILKPAYINIWPFFLGKFQVNSNIPDCLGLDKPIFRGLGAFAKYQNLTLCEFT
jgi:hypothetical protein